MFGISSWGWLLGIAIAGGYAFWTNCAYAQVTPDGTLPNNSNVTQQGSTSIITGGTQAGSNLFHSFKEFSLPTGGTAFFNNASDIQNIISRVTGGSVSNIDGLIRVNGVANLFLINPNGIIFGQNARLNIGGSFIASTASSLKFADSTELSTTALQSTPLLTVSVPIGLQFGANAKSIQNQSVAIAFSGETVGLQVQTGRTLALVGGDVLLNGGWMQAANGRVELTAVAGLTTVGLNVNGNSISLSVPQVAERANVSLTNAARIDVTDLGQGSVGINARNIDILGGSTINAGIGKGLTAQGDRSEDITLNATGSAIINQISRVANVVAVDAIGNAGDINIKAGEISITNSANAAAIDSSNRGRGSGGNISLQANSSIYLVGQDEKANDKVISSRSTQFGLDAGDISLKANGFIYLSNANLDAIGRSTKGNGGNILLQGNESVSIANNSALITTTHEEGNSGNITVMSSGRVSIEHSLISTNFGPRDEGKPFGKGSAGNIKITGRSVYVTGGGEITARSFDGLNAGNIEVNATDRVEISGKKPPRTDGDRQRNRPNDYEFSTLTTTNEAEARGFGGDINITTSTLRISDGGGLRAQGLGDLKSGNITVDAKVVELIDSGQILVSAFGKGDAGEINLNVRDRIAISGTSSDFVEVFNELSNDTNPNNTDYNTQFRTASVSPSSGIYATTESGQGGDINIKLQNVLVMSRNGQISAIAKNNGNGGNITINAKDGFIVAKRGENSDITANAFSGSGGRISIKATDIFGIAPLSRQELERLSPDDLDPSQLPTNDITAISQQNPSLSGTVELNTLELDPNNTLINLIKIPVDTEVAQGCNSPNSAQSSFIITGRGGLPLNPKDILTSEAVLVDWVTLNPNSDNRNSPSVSTNPTNPTPEPIVEATGWVFNAKGEVVFTANALTTPHSSWQKSVECRT